jgi:transposase
VLRLRLGQGPSQRAAADSLRLSLDAVNGYLRRACCAGVGWPLPAGLDDQVLERLLFPPPPALPAAQRPMPDLAGVHRELRKPNMTLALLWEEYRAGAPDGFGYSWFCDLYREWVGRLKPTLHQVHIAGERMFVDFTRHTMEVFDGTNLDYHVEIDKHYYSVPFQLLRQEVEARVTAKTVELFHRGKLVASHLRSLRRHRPSTVPDHMPSSHRRYRDWTHERIQRQAAAIGDDTGALVDVILRSRPHPEQGFRSCIGILRLEKSYGAERLDAACARALAFGTRSYTSVATILKNRQDRKAAEADPPSLFHEDRKRVD